VGLVFIEMAFGSSEATPLEGRTRDRSIGALVLGRANFGSTARTAKNHAELDIGPRGKGNELAAI
jgi:hypothetical protein